MLVSRASPWALARVKRKGLARETNNVHSLDWNRYTESVIIVKFSGKAT